MIQNLSLNKIQLVDLLRELKTLRSAFIGLAGSDAEGAYNPKFVNQVLKDSQDKNTHIFSDKKSFLKSLQ